MVNDVQHVETLRLRLRVALFKVQTNQTNIPMSQVEIPSTDAHKQSQTISTSFSTQNKDAPLKLLPAPILFPTPYSARVITQGQALSSPPRSKENSPMAVKYGNQFETPNVPMFERHGSIIQTSSPPDSLSRGSVSTKKSETLTSSAIKGNAANLLLDLKHMD